MTKKPHELNLQNVRILIPRGAKGTYELGEKIDESFHVLYIGRSDTSLRRRLTEHVRSGVYPYFRFRVSRGKRTPYRRECTNFHKFENLDNKIHPAHTDGTKCHICSTPDNFGSCIPEDDEGGSSR